MDKHRDENWDEIEMRMKILKTHKSPFERQIYEAVMIQEYRNHFLLNSKSEYNRAALPRLGLKMGDKEFKKMDDETRESQAREELLEKEITKIKKYRNLKRRTPVENQTTAKKARMEKEHTVDEHTVDGSENEQTLDIKTTLIAIPTLH